jgi:hypothetical protein
METMKFPAGTKVTFTYEGKEHTGLVDAHQLGGGFVVVRLGEEFPLRAVRETLVKPVPSD